jgi:capsular polysaccharide biosynthesis protein
MQTSEGPREIKLRDVNEIAFDAVESIDQLVDRSIATARYEVRAARSVGMLPDGPATDDVVGHIARIYEQFPGYDRVQQAAVHLFRTTGVFYLPEYGTILSADGDVYQHSFGEARYVTPTKARLPGVQLLEDGAAFTPVTPIKTLDKAFVCMPLGSIVNYGHFLTDCLLAIHIFADFLAEHAIPVVVPKLKRWQKDHLRLLDARIEVIESSASMLRIEQCFHSNIMDHFLHHLSADAGGMADRQIRGIGDARVKAPSKVFLTRGDQPLRRFRQEKELADILKGYGFVSVQPEQFSVAEQIAIFSQADVIVGATGAGFANAVYCKPGALVIELMPESFRGNVWVRNLCCIRSCHWLPFELAERREGDPVYFEGELRVAGGLEYAQDIDLSRFVDFLMPFLPQICALPGTHTAPLPEPAVAPGSLVEMALRHQTDKQGAHNYAARYETHFGPMRNKSLRVLEIGIGGYDDPRAGGQSLRMWKEFFPKALIVGIDYYAKTFLMEDRIVTCQGSQDNTNFLRSISDQYGPFDIIIDDGSHMNRHVLASFHCLFPLLKVDGIYAIEDTQTSYWTKVFEGSSLDLNASTTTMGFTKGLIDGLNHMEIERPGYIPSYYDRAISSVHFYHNQVFIYKGGNYEDSNVVVENRLPPQYSSYD